MLSLDLTGKRAFVAGVGDNKGYGWAIVRALVQAGASVRVGTWPPMLTIFTTSMERGKFDMSLPGGGEIEFEKIHPMDAMFDTPEDVPEEIREDKRYRNLSGYTIQEVAERPGGTEAARGIQPCRVPGGRERQRVLDGQHGPALRSLDAGGRGGGLPDVSRGRAGHSGIWRRHEFREGRAGE